jgi:hypothetical protein
MLFQRKVMDHHGETIPWNDSSSSGRLADIRRHIQARLVADALAPAARPPEISTHRGISSPAEWSGIRVLDRPRACISRYLRRRRCRFTHRRWHWWISRGSPGAGLLGGIPGTRPTSLPADPDRRIADLLLDIHHATTSLPHRPGNGKSGETAPGHSGPSALPGHCAILPKAHHVPGKGSGYSKRESGRQVQRSTCPQSGGAAGRTRASSRVAKYRLHEPGSR